MFNFTAARGDEELGGYAKELVGQPVAWLPLGTYTETRQWDDGERTQTVLRTRAMIVEDDSIKDLGIHLIYWAGVQQEILAQAATGATPVGVLKQVEVKSHEPGRTAFVLAPPEEEDLQAFRNAAQGSTSEPTSAPTDDSAEVVAPW